MQPPVDPADHHGADEGVARGGDHCGGQRDLLQVACQSLATLLGYRWAGVARLLPCGARAELLACWEDARKQAELSAIEGLS